MSNGFHRLILWGMAAVAAMAFSAGTVFAASLPGLLHPLPNPPGAPQTDTFLVTIPHHNVVPTRAIFTFHNHSGGRSTETSTLKKLNKYQYEATWRASTQGHVRIRVYSPKNQLVAEGRYPVVKSKTNPVGRVVIGAVFIGVSLWFWWRQQRYARQR